MLFRSHKLAKWACVDDRFGHDSPSVVIMSEERALSGFRMGGHELNEFDEMAVMRA